MLPPSWDVLSGASEAVAPRLLGCHLIRELHGRTLIGKIVETEAYDQADAASHSYRGPTERTRVMFGPAGYLYVYFTYGMHYCCNVVTGPAGHGSAVLIRAIEPIEGQEIMLQNRHGVVGKNLTNGPAKVCQALAIDKVLNGHDLREPPLKLILQPEIPKDQIVQTTRIGITKDMHRRWRFYINNSGYVSRPVLPNRG